MLQPNFLTELFLLAKTRGLGTLIDSNGTIPFSEYPKLMEVTDGVMLDIKAFDCKEHKKITDFSNETVLSNAVWLAQRGKLEEVRAVIVPDLYDTEKSVQQIGEYLLPYRNIKEFTIKVIAYRPMGVREVYSHYQVPSKDYLNYLADILYQMGYSKVIVI